MSTYLYYTQGIRDFQEETATYSEERLEIRLRRRKHRCPKCKSKDITLRVLCERDVRGYAAWQKGKVENNHTNLRRILPKGCSFNRLTQADINLVLSHLNSYIRKCYDDIPAISRFSSLFEKDSLDALNLAIIPPDDVILDPKLLKGKI